MNKNSNLHDYIMLIQPTTKLDLSMFDIIQFYSFLTYINKIHEIVLLVEVRDSSSIASLFIDIADFTLIYTFSFFTC